MTDTPNLALPYIDAAQAQKHVTHNEALRILDALVQLAVLDRDLTAPPGSPSEGQRWVVAASATDAWSGHDDDIAAWADDAWQFSTPQSGWVAYVADESTFVYWDGSGWSDLSSIITTLQNLALLGIGATADATNPFSAKLNKALWTAKTAAEGGTGDLRYTMNKEAAANVLSLLLQTNYSGRAEIGLTGDDDVHVKVSDDGASWTEALILDRVTGGLRFLAAESDVASASTCDIGAAASLKVNITGTSTISSFGTAANTLRFVRFAGALTLAHDATALILPGGADIQTAAGDSCVAMSDASGNWRLHAYQRGSGRAVVERMLPPRTASLISAMTTDPAFMRAVRIDNLIGALVDAGVWVKLDALYLFAAADAQAALLNWIDPSGTVATAVNSPAFTADRGYTGDGSTSYLDTGLTLTGAAHYALNSACMFVWSLTDLDVSGAIDLGTASDSNALIETSNASGNLVTRANDSSVAALSVSSSQGLIGWSRGSASSYDRYRNATALGAASVTSSSVGAGNVQVDHYSARQLAAAGWGSYLDSAEWGALYAALHDYMTAIGAV